MWKFKPYTEDDTRENPTQSQFFTTDEVEGLSNGLIREGIQNALDERLDENRPVRIKITLSAVNTSLSPYQYRKYIDGLTEHLFSKDSGLRKLPDFENEKMNFIVFEDFNTKGLRGNPIESKDVDIDDRRKPHNFYYFWRNIGITGKPEDKLGRWGIGKTVFPASSTINTFFGYTIQNDTKNTLLLGQSILRKHNIDTKLEDWGYKPYGYFGEFEKEGYFAKPITNESFLELFKEEFLLSRKEESGLSIVIPFVKTQINKELLLIATIKQYFFPILSNNLVVVISDEADEIVVDKDSIFKVVAQYRETPILNDEEKLDFNCNDLNSLFNFTKWAIQLKNEDYVTLTPLKPENQPRWDERLWQGVNLNALMTDFELGNKIAFKIPIKYHINDDRSSAKICWFKVFLQRDESLKRPEDHFIRENITIIDVKSLEAPGVRGIVLIDDKDLANLLGDSENPAHTQWQEGSQNFVNKYHHGDKCIGFIKKILQRVYLKLQKPATGLDKDILKDIFFLESDVTNEKPVQPDDDSKKDEQTNKVSIDIESGSKKPRVKIRKIEGGITLYCDSEYFNYIESVVVRLAYMTARGKPLSKYEKYDFELNKKPIQVIEKYCVITHREKNQLEFSFDKPDFELTVKGFDQKRDLFVDIKQKYVEND